jgi:ribosome-associated translation inhibitor RaiA
MASSWARRSAFSLLRYEKEIDRLEQWCDTHINTMFQLLTHEKSQLTQRFFEEVAVQVRKTFEHANRDAESWLKAIMAPMEIQIREHQIQLKRRLESIKRIHQATDTLEERIEELVHVEGLHDAPEWSSGRAWIPVPRPVFPRCPGSWPRAWFPDGQFIL